MGNERATFKKWKIFNRTLCLSVRCAMELAVEALFSCFMFIVSPRQGSLSCRHFEGINPIVMLCVETEQNVTCAFPLKRHIFGEIAESDKCSAHCGIFVLLVSKLMCYIICHRMLR